MSLKNKVLWDALLGHIRNLRAEVEINGFKDRADELKAARELLDDLKSKLAEEAEQAA